MAPIVAPNVTRFTVVGSYAGQPTVNVLDYLRTTISGGPMDIPEWNAAQALRIAANYVTQFAPRLSNQMSWERVDWIDLGSLDGDVGSGGVGGGGFPAAGAASTSAMPGNVALRIVKNASGQRGSRPGAIYIAGVLEAATGTNPNNLNTGDQTAWNTAADAFHTATNADLVLSNGTYGAELSIVRTRRPSPDADPVWVQTSFVEDLTPQLRLASQRRRLTL